MPRTPGGSMHWHRNTRSTSRRQPRSRSADLACPHISNGSVRCIEVRPLERVEHFPAKLKTMHTEIAIEVAGANQNARPAFPKVNCGGGANAAASNHWSMVCSLDGRLPSLIRFGRSPPPPAEFETVASVGVKWSCSPLESDKIPISVHAPSICASAPYSTVVIDHRNVPAIVRHRAPFASIAARVLRRTVAAAVDIANVPHVLGPRTVAERPAEYRFSPRTCNEMVLGGRLIAKCSFTSSTRLSD
jgi:hypothetical protein